MSRKSLLVSFLAVVLFAVAAAAAEPPTKATASPPADKPLTADEITAKYLTAIGGREKLKAVQSLRMTGTITMGPGMVAPMVIELKRPSSMRMEFTIQGMTATSAFDGEKGWQIVPFQGDDGPEELPADQIDDVRAQADIDGPLVDSKEKGITIELAGREKIDDVDAYHLKLTTKKAETRDMYVDAHTFLPIKETMKRDIGGESMSVELLISDYRDVSGVKFPHTLDNRIAGTPMTQLMKIDKIELNPALDAARFKKPEPKPTAPADPAKHEEATPEEKKP